MSLELKLTDETLISYARTDDAVEALGRSVDNGQTRLALEILVELVDLLVSKLGEVESKVIEFNSKEFTNSKVNEDVVKSKVKISKDASGVIAEEV